MTPSQYARSYHQLNTVLDNDQIVTVCIDKYLQNNGSKRNKDGLAAKDAIINGMVAETNTSWAAYTFSIKGRLVTKVDMVYVFMGKGSPSEIARAVWLASRYGLILIDPPRKNPSQVPTRTLTEFCDDCLGLDCNGFVNNFFSFKRDKSISTYDGKYPKGRRQRLSEVQANDVVVFIEEDDATAKNPKAGPTSGTSYPHIALIDAVSPAGPDQLLLSLVQSSGNEVGLHTTTDVKKCANYGKGVFFESGVAQGVCRSTAGRRGVAEAVAAAHTGKIRVLDIEARRKVIQEMLCED